MPPSFTTEGIDAAKRIRAEFPETGVVVLSQYVEEQYAFELLSDGVAGLGYLLKERVTEVDDLVRALYDVSRGGSVLDPQDRRGADGPEVRRAHLGPVGAHRAGATRSSRSWPPAAATRPPRRRCS